MATQPPFYYWVVAFVGLLSFVAAPSASGSSVGCAADPPVTRSGFRHIPTIQTDLDGDNRPDSIFASADGSQIDVQIFLSSVSGYSEYQFQSTDQDITVLACDITEDGACDLVFSSEATSRPIAVCVNRGDGTFDVHRGCMGDAALANEPFRDQCEVSLTSTRRSGSKKTLHSAGFIRPPPSDTRVTQHRGPVHIDAFPLAIFRAVPPRGPPAPWLGSGRRA